MHFSQIGLSLHFLLLALRFREGDMAQYTKASKILKNLSEIGLSWRPMTKKIYLATGMMISMPPYVLFQHLRETFLCL